MDKLYLVIIEYFLFKIILKLSFLVLIMCEPKICGQPFAVRQPSKFTKNTVLRLTDLIRKKEL